MKAKPADSVKGLVSKKKFHRLPARRNEVVRLPGIHPSLTWAGGTACFEARFVPFCASAARPTTQQVLPEAVTMAEKLPISVCVVSAAEVSRIGATLESVAPWAAEIVVVLNEDVTDGTDEVARRYGARVFREPWKGFVGQKQSVSDKASQPWLLNLDADEVVSPGLAREVVAVVSASATPHAAYEFPRRTFYCGRWIRHGDWYPDRVLRLWKRGAARWSGENPHARLQVDGTVGRLCSDLLHHSNESIARQIAKIVPYNAGFAQKWAGSGRSVGLFEMAFRSGWRFVRAYIFRLGFLDGWQGFYIAAMSSFSTLTRYSLVREAVVQKQPKP
jgi:glycosyltransferase involved in cell wall biosynthesis